MLYFVPAYVSERFQGNVYICARAGRTSALTGKGIGATELGIGGGSHARAPPKTRLDSVACESFMARESKIFHRVSARLHTHARLTTCSDSTRAHTSRKLHYTREWHARFAAAAVVVVEPAERANFVYYLYCVSYIMCCCW